MEFGFDDGRSTRWLAMGYGEERSTKPRQTVGGGDQAGHADWIPAMHIVQQLSILETANSRPSKVQEEVGKRAESHSLLRRIVQDANGRRQLFVHEHPRRATSLQMRKIAKLAATPGVESTVCDKCAYDM